MDNTPQVIVNEDGTKSLQIPSVKTLSLQSLQDKLIYDKNSLETLKSQLQEIQKLVDQDTEYIALIS